MWQSFYDGIREHEVLLMSLGGLSIVMFFGTLALAPVVIVRMSADYFLEERVPATMIAHRHPILRAIGLAAKNIAGALLFLVGLALIPLPGQGLLTILLALTLMDVPGKRAFELRLIRLPGVLKIINKLRARRHRPPLQLPPRKQSAPSS